VFDIDNFGGLNDRYGVEECDRMLVEIAATLSQGRAADSFFRIGDDEFATIMPNTSKEGAEIAAIRLGWSVAKLREDDCDLTVSAGVAQAEVPDPRVFFAEAEAALREGKNAGARSAMSA
jgi:diguanylate cyclase (GGDEF)-like protein